MLQKYYGEGKYLTLDKKLYANDGTKIDDDVEMFLGGNLYDDATYHNIYYYLTSNNQLFSNVGTQKTLIADNVKTLFASTNEDDYVLNYYYISNDNKIYNFAGEEVSEEQIQSEQNSWSSLWYEDENGKIFYMYEFGVDGGE